jgi:mono/diheme cytochrome c family protein
MNTLSSILQLEINESRMTRKTLYIIICISTCCTICGAQERVLTKSISRGKEIYLTNCISCHMERGEGIEGTFPPLVKTEYVMGEEKRLIDILLKGQSGDIVVGGKPFSMEMPAQGHLSDEEVADVLNYIRNSWGNKAEKAISPSQVRGQRE